VSGTIAPIAICAAVSIWNYVSLMQCCAIFDANDAIASGYNLGDATHIDKQKNKCNGKGKGKIRSEQKKTILLS
jgi:hypothetical protein